MSAIAGIVSLAGDPGALAQVTSLAAAMSVNARDGGAEWVGRRAALAHLQTQATPQAAYERQPLIGAGGQVLVMEGRLDNREELISALQLADRSVPDGEVVLAAYERWGEDCPSRLLGDFAFAVWDERECSLFIATDAVGACQVYFACHDGFFAFASTEEALLALREVAATPDPHMLAYFSVPPFHTFGEDSTWLADVRVSTAAQTLKFDASGQLHKSTYWQLQARSADAPRTWGEALEGFEAVFGEAVRARLRSSGSVSQMLSGGIDSACIRGAVTRERSAGFGDSYRTYSVVSPDPSCIETHCIRSLAEGVDAEFIDYRSAAQSVANVLWSRPHPCDNSIPVPAVVCAAAAARGERVLLHGMAGDLATFVPQRYLAYLLREGHWGTAIAEGRHATANHTVLRNEPFARLMAANVWTALAPSPLKRLAFAARPWRSPVSHSAIHPQLAERFSIDDVLHQRAATSRALAPTVEDAHREALTCRHGVASGMAGFNRLGKRFGLELRDPWADRRVLEYLLAVPLRLKLRGGWTKALPRHAFAEAVPAHVRFRRGKEHLGPLTLEAMMACSRDVVQDALAAGDRYASSFVDVAQVRARADAYFAAPAAVAPRGECEFVYSRAALFLWLRRIAGSRHSGSGNMV